MTDGMTNPAGESSGTVNEAADALFRMMGNSDSSDESEDELSAPETEADESSKLVETETEEEAEAEESEEDQPEADDESKGESDVFEINGREVTEEQLLEWSENGLRLEDYTRKSQQNAQERKEFEEQKLAWEQEFQAEKERWLAKYADQTTRELQAYQTTDWDKLREEDPIAYAEQWTDFQRVLLKADEADKELRQEREALTAQQQAQHQEWIAEQNAKLSEWVPELLNPATQQAKVKSMTEFMNKVGFTNDELKGIEDARLYLLIEKARQWDELQETGQEAVKAKRVVRKTKSLTAGNTDPNQVADEAAAKAKKARLKKLQDGGGRVEDAAEIFFQSMQSK